MQEINCLLCVVAVYWQCLFSAYEIAALSKWPPQAVALQYGRRYVAGKI